MKYDILNAIYVAGLLAVAILIVAGFGIVGSWVVGPLL